MPGAGVRAARASIADDVEFGGDVLIEADDVRIGSGCRIGVTGDDAFRTPGGVRVRVRSLVLGDGVHISGAVAIRGGDIELRDDVYVGRGTTIDVADRLTVGESGAIGDENDIRGRDIVIGQELWTGPRARIGGGSAYEATSRLRAGHYLHLGMDTLVNTARPVAIGHEVGLGTRTSIYTHGAYASRLQGFPVSFDEVSIGDFTWIPGAVVNPGVRIGRNCVIGVNSLVTASIPDGSLAAGSPAKVLREGAYPRPLDGDAYRTFALAFLTAYDEMAALGGHVGPSGAGARLSAPGLVIHFGPNEPALHLPDDGRRLMVVGDGWFDGDAPGTWTRFDTRERRVSGVADALSARLANELRRNGIRFYSRATKGAWHHWASPVPRH